MGGEHLIKHLGVFIAAIEVGLPFGHDFAQIPVAGASEAVAGEDGKHSVFEFITHPSLREGGAKDGFVLALQDGLGNLILDGGAVDALALWRVELIAGRQTEGELHQAVIKKRAAALQACHGAHPVLKMEQGLQGCMVDHDVGKAAQTAGFR